jgi:thioredoxin reductase
MINNSDFDVIIIGGSYSGLSAGLALGRASRKVLIIDSGKPCNRQTPHSHNFLTQDGKPPAEIISLAKAQIKAYKTVSFYEGLASAAAKVDKGFTIDTQAGEHFSASKLIFATGVEDNMLPQKGFSECWGISIIHCPYCHGYEVKNEPTGVLGNGEFGFEFAKLVSNWTKSLTLFTNGLSTLTTEQKGKLKKHNIPVVEKEILEFDHHKGYLKSLIFKDGSASSLKALYAKSSFRQHCDLPRELGCELTEQGHIKADAFQRTNVHGIYACGDNTTPMRSLSNAVSMGTFAGTMINKELIDDYF